MLRLIIVRPGTTDLDEQGRIKGTLDIPLNAQGAIQADQAADELHSQQIDRIYSAPCQSARQTADCLAGKGRAKVKLVKNLRNIDLGLWNGRLIAELKEKQPKLYRQWQEHPETVQPPGGESLEEAQLRVMAALQKIVKKNRSGVVAVVVPEPLASIARAMLVSSDLGNLWQAECNCCGSWESIDVEPESFALS